MADNFFKVKNGLNLPNYTGGSFPTLSNPATGDLVFYNGALYVYNGTAWVVKPGSGLTGLITNADVDATAGIVDTKLATISTAGKVSGTAITSGNISTTGDFTTSGSISTTGTGDITAARILKSLGELQVITNVANPAVYIEQSHSTGQALVVADQASPDSTVTVIDSSGSVGIGVAADASLVEKLTVAGDVKVTTGDIKLDTAKGIESSAAASTLNIGTGTNTTTLNLGTGSSTQTVNIGTGAGVTTINIGGTGDTVVVSGTLTTVNTTNLDVADKNITLNKGGLAGSANGSGISIEAGGSSVASLSFDQTDGSSQPQNTFTLSGTGSLALPAGTTAQRPNTPANGMIRYNSSNGAFEGYASGAWSGIGGGGTIDKVTQASHGFVVGDVLYINGGNYAKAQADTAIKAEVVGMVSRVIDASNFELTLNGEVSGLAGLTMGENYFLSASSAGAITATEPSVVGQISLPIGVASSTTTLYVAPKRGSVVGGANVRTQISLANNATTNVQNAGSYDAGSIEGWVYLDATTDYRFHVRANFAKNGLANDYNLSYQTTGDTPPAGFSMGITAAGVITATLPSLAGFVTGGSYINFALNAPAVGATLPLQISGGLVTGPVLGAGTGAAVAAGYIGENLSQYATSNTTINSFTTADINGASITLSPGVWLLIGNIGGYFTSTGGNANCDFVIAKSDNTAVQTSTANWTAGALTGLTSTITTPVNVTSSTTYKLRYTSTSQGASAISGTVLTLSRIQAVRIA